MTCQPTASGVPLEAYLFLGAMLFTLGVVAVLGRRNPVGMLIGVELMINGVIVNFMAFWHAGADSLSPSGPLIAICLMVLAAAEAAIVLAILINLRANFGGIDTAITRRLKL